jgi:glycerol-3-phosphate dehydrogenase (NAD(P)+)
MNIAVLGAGSWGTTLAEMLCGNGHTVTLWAWSAADADVMLRTRRNAAYLPDLHLPDAIAITTDLAAAAADRDMLVLATPAQHVRETLVGCDASRLGDALVVNVAKGIETVSLQRMSGVVLDVWPAFPPSRYAVLSGPSHAEEVSIRRPTTVVAASVDARTSATVIGAFMTDSFRVYSSADVTGVELGGSLKNVIAIGAGICDGAQFGDNTKAALITRGIAEMRRLGIALGADPHTFAGLSGLGDLIVTTMSRHSRNRYVGEQIGTGRTLADILSHMAMIAEGVETTHSAHDLALRTGVEMPIIAQVHRILFEDRDPVEATRELMTRQVRDEVW